MPGAGRDPNFNNRFYAKAVRQPDIFPLKGGLPVRVVNIGFRRRRLGPFRLPGSRIGLRRRTYEGPPTRARTSQCLGGVGGGAGLFWGGAAMPPVRRSGPRGGFGVGDGEGEGGVLASADRANKAAAVRAPPAKSRSAKKRLRWILFSLMPHTVADREPLFQVNNMLQARKIEHTC